MEGSSNPNIERLAIEPLEVQATTEGTRKMSPLLDIGRSAKSIRLYDEMAKEWQWKEQSSFQPT